MQYKEVKLPADKILENLGDSRLPPSLQVAYVATDERNKTFFDAFKKRFKTVSCCADCPPLYRAAPFLTHSSSLSTYMYV